MSDLEPKGDDILDRAKVELSSMAKDGLKHPTTKPVLIGGAIGLLIGVLALDGAGLFGILVGAAVALYLQIKD